MESASGSEANKTIVSTITTPTTVTTTTTSAVSVASVASAAADNTNHKSSPLLLARGSSNSGIVVTPPNSTQKQQQQQLLQLDTKQEETNNLSLANIMAEGTRSVRCGAPSTSSSPTLSPPGKIFGRNANGTMIATSRPSNEAEIQLYRVLQRASLLAYYDTLLEMGGDDVQQLYEAGEEEFLEIMALVGMASKPLHVRRLQKVLHEWANNPNFFQGPMVSGSTGVCEITPTKAIYIPETAASVHTKLPSSITNAFNPTPLISTTHTNFTHPVPQLTTSTALPPVAGLQSALSYPSLSLASAAPSQSQPKQLPPSGVTHHVTSSSPQLTPVLTEIQVARVTMGAEKIARQLPQREPRAQTSKKRTSRELEQVIGMSEHDPRRMEEIRKYSAIYGRFDCKRRPEKPLTLHEVCVNEAAAQLCRLVPALLTRRDELFPLARQIVKDAGFGHSASIARYGGLVPHTQVNQGVQRSGVSVVDCESSDTSSPMTPKRARLSSTDTAIAQESNREHLDDSRFNLFAMYQKFSKPPFDLSDITKFPLGKSHYDDNDDSRFSFTSSSSPSLPQNTSSDPEREFAGSPVTYVVDSVAKSCSPYHSLQPGASTVPECQSTSINLKHGRAVAEATDTLALTSSSLGVEVLSAAGSHIIAVTNPALALSPTLNDKLAIKREIGSPDV